MNKSLNEKNNSNEVNEWSFPKIELSPKQFKKEIVDDSQKLIEIRAIEANINENLKVELKKTEDLQKEYEHKIAILTNALTKMEQSLSVLDDELIHLFEEIIAKITKKIIHKEIKLEPNLMTNIVAELTELLHVKKGMINIIMSEHDYRQFDKEILDKHFSLKVDPSFAEGDLVIKSNYGEIRGLLDERIEKVMGIKNE